MVGSFMAAASISVTSAFQSGSNVALLTSISTTSKDITSASDRGARTEIAQYSGPAALWCAIVWAEAQNEGRTSTRFTQSGLCELTCECPQTRAMTESEKTRDGPGKKDPLRPGCSHGGRAPLRALRCSTRFTH
jgi:hypothetical protein